MPVLIVKLENEERHIPFMPGPSLRDILDDTDVRVRSGCRGIGTCGLCRVRVEAEEVIAPTLNERIMLEPNEIEAGIRLACQIIPTDDILIELLAPAHKSNWRNLPDGPCRNLNRDLHFPVRDIPPDVKNPYGVAVDLGTTHISISLYELARGKWLAGRYGSNPQAWYGSDVMTRLIAATESQKCALDMSRLLFDAIREGLLDIAARDGINIKNVTRILLVGNTAVLALLTGRNQELLIQPKHWMEYIDCLPENTDAWAESMCIHPHARICVLPPLAGFVGSDLLAGVSATELTVHGAGALFIDFGTNSEIALWDGRDLWVTSAAGGPAFEESGIGCGAVAEPGAIHRVTIRDGKLGFDVIADAEPHGLCGSGMVDLIACLLKTGQLNEKGCFTAIVPIEGIALARGTRNIILTRRDVDMFQRAKAAIGTGIQVLLDRAGMRSKDLRRVCVGGIFGRFLDIDNAREIGLLPPVPTDRVELRGNTALAGCAAALVLDEDIERLRDLGERATVINLSNCADFEELFMRNLYLMPMDGD